MRTQMKNGILLPEPLEGCHFVFFPLNICVDFWVYIIVGSCFPRLYHPSHLIERMKQLQTAHIASAFTVPDSQEISNISQQLPQAVILSGIDHRLKNR